MRHLVIGQCQKAPNFSAFHWSPQGCLITISQHIVTTRVVHLPKRTETSLIIESDQSRANHQLLQLCTVRTADPIRTRLCGLCIAAKASFYVKTRFRFSLGDKRLFKITKVEITRVACMMKFHGYIENQLVICLKYDPQGCSYRHFAPFRQIHCRCLWGEEE